MIKLLRYYSTLLPELIFLLIWFGVQCYLFADTFTGFRGNPNFASTNALTGYGVATAKACASVINFNCTLLIVSMCQISVTFLRGTWMSHVIPFDGYIQLHQLSSISIILFSIVHTIAHYINYTKIPTSWFSLALLTGPGATGHIIWLTLIIISLTSFIKRIKKWKFEVFWYAHHLAFVFLSVLSFR